MNAECRKRLPVKIEIGEEPAWLLGEYERHVRLHRMKVNAGAVETVVTITSQFMEAIASGKYSQATGLFFVAKHRKIALTEAELHAPGREVSCISKARARGGATPG